jgi:uncharacterized protein with von Willebrand factor type A (vWA) domain
VTARPSEQADPPSAPRLAHNVVLFGRLLRDAGLPVGTDRILLGLQALRITGIERRDDFRGVLAACMLERTEQRALFDEAFDRFWIAPGWPARSDDGGAEAAREPAPAASSNRRLAQALAALRGGSEGERADRTESKAEALAASAIETLRKADFEAMSVDEWHAAQRLLSEWRMHLPRVPTRRYRPSSRGSRVDWRRIAAESARRAGDIAQLARRSATTRATPLVALIDISGSMSRYSRIFLQFLHALAGGHRGTHAFLFGTRLTGITRTLRHRDPDVALRACLDAVDDWGGGTRIGASLHEFNLRWSRRVLGQNATVLLVSDGLEREDADLLGFEAERLSKSCRRLLWLNPLLRYRGFEPRAAGVRAILPHVDAHLPVHNLDSLRQLSQELGAIARHPRTASKSQ